MYEAKISGKPPFSNVNMSGEKKATVATDHKFYGKMTSDGAQSNPFNTPAPNARRIGNFAENDYGSMKAVYRDKGTAKVFGKGY